MSGHEDGSIPRSSSGKPLPTITSEAVPFWESARGHQLSTQCCSDCGGHQFPPRLLCGHCGGRTLGWKLASGKGKVYSFTIVHRAPEEAFAAEVPYVVAVVDLAEGGRIMTNITGCAPDEVRVDMPVQAVFDDITDAVTLVRFRPVALAGG